MFLGSPREPCFLIQQHPTPVDNSPVASGAPPLSTHEAARATAALPRHAVGAAAAVVASEGAAALGPGGPEVASLTGLDRVALVLIAV